MLVNFLFLIKYSQLFLLCIYGVFIIQKKYQKIVVHYSLLKFYKAVLYTKNSLDEFRE